MLALLIAAISINGAAQLGLAGFLGTVVIATVLVMAYSAVTWLVTGYHVVGRELRIYDGVLVRRTRAIPLERLQAVELVRPLMARATGLAELRLEVVGGGKTEAPLAFLTVADATALRNRLLALAVRVGAPAAAPGGQAAPLAGAAAPGAAPSAVPPPPPTGEIPPAHPEPPDQPVPPAHPAPPDQPVPPVHPGYPAPGYPAQGYPGYPPPGYPPPGYPAAPAPAAPAPLAERHLHSVVNRDVLISQILTPQVIFLPIAIALVVTQYWFGARAWSLVVLASMAAAVIGVIQQPVRRIMSDWNFRMAVQDPPPGKRHPGLRIRSGLTETRSQTVPLNRVQAIGVTWPFLWRRRQWLRSRLDVAGYGVGEGAGSDRLLPVGDLATARRLTSVVLPGIDLTDLRLRRPPRRARWLAPWRQPVLGIAMTDEVFVSRDGRITRELVVVPYLRIQSVRLTQGPIQRLLGLANVYADTAGSLTAVGSHRELGEARRLAAELTARAQAARDADAALTGAESTSPDENADGTADGG
nr:PH domain-containing protein [Natronosporangium hydrolyticum]